MFTEPPPVDSPFQTPLPGASVQHFVMVLYELGLRLGIVVV